MPITTLLLDLGDVLFTWSRDNTHSIPLKTLGKIVQSPPWFEMERGQISRAECYKQCAALFSLDARHISTSFVEARASLQINVHMVELVQDLVSQSQGKLRVYAVSNIGAEDWEELYGKPFEWSIFDRIFTSAGLGARKPELGFYRKVVEATGINPEETVFVDDLPDNVLSARSIGMHGIVFDDFAKVEQALRALIENPIERGLSFLSQNSRKLKSITENGVEVDENFAQLLILELTKNPSLVTLPTCWPDKWNFFAKEPIFTTTQFPTDLDTTSIGLTVVQYPDHIVSSVMDEMLQFVTPDNIIQTYFDHTRPRFDPVVCVNVLTLFYTHGRGNELKATMAWVLDVLRYRAYLDGTRYYTTPECFLYFTSRLLARLPPCERKPLRSLLRDRVRERVGVPADALALAMRILAARTAGVRPDVDLTALLTRQCGDGGWEAGWMYKYGSSGLNLGNRGVTTAMAVKAIESMMDM